MKVAKTFVIGLAELLLLPAMSFAGHLPGSYVTPEWLFGHRADQDIRIIDVSLSRKDYDAEHIPESVFVDWRTDLAEADEKHYFILPRQAFEGLMSRIGVTRETHLVFYDNFDNRLAIRALWVAEYYGHPNTAILEGGIGAWKSRGHGATNRIPVYNRSRYIIETVNESLNVDRHYVERNLSNPKVLFVDGRPSGMYVRLVSGKAIHNDEWIARRGHLPGAVNLPWKSLMNNRAEFLDPNTLEAMYRERGIDEEKDAVVFYCNQGLHAAFDWFVAAKILGFDNARIYDGSMSEWAENPDLPLVMGRD